MTINVLPAFSYEESTWVPTFQGTSSNPVVTYSTQAGKYTKIGKLVILSGEILLSAASGGTGNLVIGGLPYTVTSTSGYRGACTIAIASGFTSTTTPHNGIPSTSASTIALLRNASTDARDASNTSMAATDLTATSRVAFSATYYTD